MNFKVGQHFIRRDLSGDLVIYRIKDIEEAKSMMEDTRLTLELVIPAATLPNAPVYRFSRVFAGDFEQYLDNSHPWARGWRALSPLEALAYLS